MGNLPTSEPEVADYLEGASSHVRSITPALQEYLIFRIEKLERAHKAGKLTNDQLWKQKSEILTSYPSVGEAIAKAKAGQPGGLHHCGP